MDCLAIENRTFFVAELIRTERRLVRKIKDRHKLQDQRAAACACDARPSSKSPSISATNRSHVFSTPW